ncbi:MAG: hypothetical protein ACRD3J_13925 [Thermoanaerobaculia bacterium]
MNDNFKRFIDAAAAETARYLEESARLREGMSESVVNVCHDIAFMGEHIGRNLDALAQSITLLGEKIDREAENIRREMRIGFAETQAMLKFSQPEYDRVERLEDLAP